jgi:hypothetical protein
MAITFLGALTISPTALYPFTSFTFTPVGTTGPNGPSGSTLLVAYTGSTSGSYFSNPLYFTTGAFNGYQVWTVPSSATYEIEVAGSRAGVPINNFSIGYGKGAIIKGRIYLSQGQKLTMVAGQYMDASGSNIFQSASYMGLGGGGGSFVALSGSSQTPLFVAGGGGGTGRYVSFNGGTAQVGKNGVTTISGSSSVLGAPGGTGSLGGRSHISTGSVISVNSYDGGAGAGWNGNGQNGDGTLTRPFTGGTYGEGGNSFVSGSKGGSANSSWGNPSTYAASWGGFGGGGSGNGIIDGGGGGGYSGGGGGYWSASPAADGGGGGGSYITSSVTNVSTSDGNYDGLSTFSGSVITNLSSYNSGSGYIKITKIG